MTVPVIRRLTEPERGQVVGVGFITRYGAPGYVTGIPERPLTVGAVLEDDVSIDMVGAGCLTGRVFWLRAGDAIEEVNPPSPTVSVLRVVS